MFLANTRFKVSRGRPPTERQVGKDTFSNDFYRSEERSTQRDQFVMPCNRACIAADVSLAHRSPILLLTQLIVLSAGCSGGAVVSEEQAAYEAIQSVDGARITISEDGNVVKVVARGPQMTDAQAAHLTAFSQLRNLQVEGSAITDAGLEALRDMKNLETLRAERTSISDAGMRHLAEMTGLRELFVAGCPLSDAGLAPLGELTKLKLLNLNETSVTDAGLQHLAGLTKLESLYLRSTKVRGRGLQHLVNLENLRLLNLGSPSVTDASLEFAGQFENLEMLYLDTSAISDAGVSTLMESLRQRASGIKGLFLEQTQLTDAAVEPLLQLANLKDLTLVHLHATQITKPAFMKLVKSMPDVSFVADYPAAP